MLARPFAADGQLSSTGAWTGASSPGTAAPLVAERAAAESAGMPSGPVLLITCDDQLLDDLLRLAAAAGTGLEVAHDTTSALRAWAGAALVLVGADLAGTLAAQDPPRRELVYVVGVAPLADGLFRSALGAGAAGVVELPAAETWLVEQLTDATDAAGGRRVRHGDLVGVVGGSGGVGATTLACALALVSARREAAALVDLDPLGPGTDRVVGLDGAAGVHWDELVGSRGRLGSRSLRSALPEKDGLVVLTWAPGPAAPLQPAAVREVLSAAQRGNDRVVLDLPRALDEIAAEAATRCDRLLLVVEPTVAGVAAAARVTALLRPLNDRIGLVLRRRAGTVPAPEVVTALGLPLVAEAPHHRRLAEHVDLGLGPVHAGRSALARCVETVLGPVGRHDGLVRTR